MFKDKKRDLVVVVSLTDWSEPPRIRHQVTRQLAKNYNILYVQLYSNFCKNLHSLVFENDIAFLKLGFRVPGLGRLFYYFSFVEILFGRYVAQRVMSAVKKLGYSKAVLVNFQFNMAEIYDLDIFAKKIFICNDDFINLNPNYSDDRRRYLESRQHAVSLKSDFLYAVSQSLCDKINFDLGKSACELLLPGVEFVDVDVLNIRTGRPSCSKISVAFMGYVDDRLNWDWIRKILDDGRFTITFIGPINSENFVDVSENPNVRSIGFLSGHNLVEKLAEFDVLTIPYDVSQKAVQAIAISNKFFQYLNAGRPVVISNMPGFVNYDEGVLYRANSAEEFVDSLILAAQNDSCELIDFRISIAKQNSWDERAKILFDVIDN